LIAPNGLRVAVIEVAEVSKVIELMKGMPRMVELGLVIMQIEPNNLVAGSEFMASPGRFVYRPTVGGACPRAWNYPVHAKFDGSRLTARLHKIFMSIQNRNLATPVSDLEWSEELVIAIPVTALELTATLALPSTSTELLGHFTLLDRRK
jgi:hypothetical protein